MPMKWLRPKSHPQTHLLAPVRAPQRHQADAWGVGGLLLGLCVALVWFAPARWVGMALAQATGQRVLLTQAQGFWWQGEAGLALAGGAGAQDRAALAGKLSWRLHPSSQGVQVQLRADCCMPSPWQISLHPRWSGGLTLEVQLQAHQSQWPASLLVGLGTPWNTLQLQAGVHLKTQGLRLLLQQGRVQTEGEMVLELRDASSRLSTIQPMGTYRLVWQGAGVERRSDSRSDTLSLSTVQGALQLQGQGQWLAGRLRFSGEAQAAPGREEALSNLMNILGRRQGPKTLIQIG
jgi:general secretion pathway protein N